MSEELNTEIEDTLEKEGAEPEVEVKERKMSPVEEKARASGWLPKDEWEALGNDPEEWVPAKVFNDKGELFGRIHKQSRHINELMKAVNDLRELNATIAENTKKQTLKELKKARLEAVEEGNTAAVLDLDDKIEEVKAMPLDKEPPAERQQGPSPEFQEAFANWKASNQWYTSDAELREYADFIGTKLAAEGKSYEEVFQLVPMRVKAAFPAKFSNPRKRVPTAEDGGNPGNGGRGSRVKLTEEQRAVQKRFASLGIMTEKEYIESLQQAGVI